MSKKFQCTNFGNCQDADNGTVFEESKVEEIDGSYSCPTCHQKLEEIQQKQILSGKTIGILAAALAVVAGIVLAILFLHPKSSPVEPEGQSTPVVEESETVVEQPAVVHDTVVVEKTDTVVVKPEPKPTPKPAGPRVNKLSYGSFKGQLKNGLPHDVNGTLTYSERHLIDSRDPQKRYAEPGDYVIGEFSEGKLVQGVWYDKSNNVKGSIIIGK